MKTSTLFVFGVVLALAFVAGMIVERICKPVEITPAEPIAIRVWVLTDANVIVFHNDGDRAFTVEFEGIYDLGFPGQFGWFKPGWSEYFLLPVH